MKYAACWTKERRPIHTYNWIFLLNISIITCVQCVSAAPCAAVAKARGSRRNVLEAHYWRTCMLKFTLYMLHHQLLGTWCVLHQISFCYWSRLLTGHTNCAELLVHGSRLQCTWFLLKDACLRTYESGLACSAAANSEPLTFRGIWHDSEPMRSAADFISHTAVDMVTISHSCNESHCSTSALPALLAATLQVWCIACIAVIRYPNAWSCISKSQIWPAKDRLLQRHNKVLESMLVPDVLHNPCVTACLLLFDRFATYTACHVSLRHKNHNTSLLNPSSHTVAILS